MPDLEISDAGRYDNVFVGSQLVASFDHDTGEFVVYDPNSDSEDPAYAIQADPVEDAASPHSEA